MIPEKVGRYIILSELGRGGMATVYRAKDPNFDREVAVKILPRTFLHDPQFRTRFEREAKTIATLEHAAIVPVYDFGEEDGQPFIVMRLMSGGSLADKINKGKLSLDEAVRIITQLAPGLDAAHKNGIVHRDLKPGNILFDQYGDAYLSDFGIARLTEGEGTLTGSMILGTPAYMSPEQIQGEKDLDGRSDIYAMGVIFYQMLVGTTPFQASTPAKVMMMHILEPVPNLLAALPTVPARVEAWFERTLAKNPDDRFSRALEMGNSLEAAYRGDAPTLELLSQTLTATSSENAVTRRSRSPTPFPQAGKISPIQGRFGPQAVPQDQVPQEIYTPPSAPAGNRKRVLYSIIGCVVVLGIGLVAVIALGLSGLKGLGPLSMLAPYTPTAEIFSTFRENTLTLEPTHTQQAPKDEVALIESTSTPEEILPTATAKPPTLTPEPRLTPTLAIQVVGGADKIAFINANDIWFMNMDGTDLKQVTNDAAEKSKINWLPDGSAITYISGKCIWSVEVDSQQIEAIACFEAAEYLESFSVSPDGTKVAISVNRELYVVPFDVERLQTVRSNSDLKAMGDCASLAPLLTSTNTAIPIKLLRWSKDGQKIIILKLANVGGLQADLIQILEIQSCSYTPIRVDEIPAARFSVEGYDNTPYIQNFGYDGENLLSFVSYTRNDGFGHLYIYNAESHRADLKINPINGVCCYRDPQFSPDGRYLFLVFQAYEVEAKIQFFYIPIGTIGTGASYEPIPLPDDFFQNPKGKPQPILRSAQK